MNDPIKSQFSSMFALLLLSMACIIFFIGCMHFVSSVFAFNETEEEETDTALQELLVNMSANRTITYQNITILDKEYKQRSFRSDVYNVVYRMEDGNLTKTNDMELYYSVEEGKAYNVSWVYGVEDVIGEVYI